MAKPQGTRRDRRTAPLRWAALAASAAALLACDAFEPPCDDGCGPNVRVPPPMGFPPQLPPTMARPVPTLPSWDAGAAKPLETGPCQLPQQAECACEDGRRGMRECVAGHPYGACMCTGPVPPPDERCLPGSVVPCSCDDGGEGVSICRVAREPGACDCTTCGGDDDAGCAGPAPACADADAFDGVCPGDPVRGGAAGFEGSVYFVGTLMEGNCLAQVLQPFWPLLRPEYYGPFDCRYSDARFGGAEEELFLIHPSEGLIQFDDAGQPWAWPTPPCAGRPAAVRFFAGDAYAYQCDRSVYLADGTLVAQDVEQLVQATANGRLLVTQRHATGQTLAVLDAMGQTLSTLTPGERASGRFEVLPLASTTTPGSEAFVLWQRELDGGGYELVAYRLSADAEWQPLRRVAAARGYTYLLLPDGTVFSWEADAGGDGLSERIQVWLRDGTEESAWSERDHADLRVHGRRQLLLGPAMPKGMNVGRLDWP